MQYTETEINLILLFIAAISTAAVVLDNKLLFIAILIPGIPPI